MEEKDSNRHTHRCSNDLQQMEKQSTSVTRPSLGGSHFGLEDFLAAILERRGRECDCAAKFLEGQKDDYKWVHNTGFITCLKEAINVCYQVFQTAQLQVSPRWHSAEQKSLYNNARL